MIALTVAALAQGIPEHAVAWRDAVDWELAGDEAARWLSAYIQVDTVAPPGNELDGVGFLKGILDAEGFATTVVDHGDNRGSLIARLAGNGSAPPVCLLSHIDVVPSERENWTTEPLGGEIRDGQVWGRGALDMKGMGVVELAAAVQIARLGVPLDRDIVLLAVADEEVDGLGMKALVADHWDDIGCSHLINEGGLGLADGLFEGQTLHAISVAEKGTLWVRLVASGRSGHGSTIEPGEAPERLREAMELVDRKYRPKPSIDPIFFELFERVGEDVGGVTGAILKSRFGVRTFVKPKLKKRSTTAAALVDTLHLTGMGGASSVNVVPSEVWAQYDSRLLLGTDPRDQLAKLERITRKLENVRWEVIDEEAANGSPIDDPFFDAIARHATDGRPGHVAGPVLSVGFTDSIFARPLGVHAYGYVPFVVTQDEALTMHGHDERVSLENLREGTRRMFGLLVDFAGTAVPPDPATLAMLGRLEAIPRATDDAGFAEELRARVILDQELVGALPPVLTDAERAAWDRHEALVKAVNAARLAAWVREHGWPTLTAVGERGAQDAWLIAQHADHDRALQADILAGLHPLAASGEVTRTQAAYLEDRLAVAHGRPQRYGTQGGCQGRFWTPAELEDPDGVDVRRASVGLEPMASYRGMFDCDGTLERADAAYRAEDWVTCEAAYAARGSPSDLYNAACCAARGGRVDRGFELLRAALMSGFSNHELIAGDPDLELLRQDPRWPVR